MPKRSAGVLLYRRSGGTLEVLLVRPGGPLWEHRRTGAWQLPKGLIEPGEDGTQAARRETKEELGVTLAGEPVPLATIRQAGGKWVEAFALEQSIDVAAVRSNSFEMEWPRGSGRRQSFPEVAEARWFACDAARDAMLASQRPLIDALEMLLG
ncbi:NUDIX hydrolase [Sphingomonas spermidinifaciens]|uniref:NUDIX hydrolase n=1 Tax=Sphingomonas spermidinifaciens TaxID=1141889 RepID=A0A2A4B3A3_9SPHN|nr:NUDIX domain-containing protein [Sphingomonas spermidinifaciens]PCD02164.1 NUDIX hydrolase [Sphingomonas spermidinifaciens]